MGGKLFGSFMEYVSRYRMSIDGHASKVNIKVQDRDSPGPSDKSTTSMAGCVSKVGNGLSGSISTATSFPSSSPRPLGLAVLDRILADVGVLEGTYPDVDRHFEDVAEFGVGLDDEEVGVKIDSSPAESDDDRL